MHKYTAQASGYVRGMVIVTPDDPSPLCETAKLCEAFAAGRYSFRERGYLLSAATTALFRKAASYGCTSDGQIVRWESPDGMRAHSFAAQHCKRALAEIKRDRSA